MRTSSLIDQSVHKIARCKVCTISRSQRLPICLSTAECWQLAFPFLKCPCLMQALTQVSSRPVLQVTPFSRWERELPKLVGDSRYKAIDKPKERRQIFDDFCRNVAQEQNRSKERKERQAAAAETAFLALLDEAQAWSEEDQEAAGCVLPALSMCLAICSGHLLG